MEALAKRLPEFRSFVHSDDRFLAIENSIQSMADSLPILAEQIIAEIKNQFDFEIGQLLSEIARLKESDRELRIKLHAVQTVDEVA